MMAEGRSFIISRGTSTLDHITFLITPIVLLTIQGHQGTWEKDIQRLGGPLESFQLIYVLIKFSYYHVHT
jgi:hypothetical protein